VNQLLRRSAAHAFVRSLDAPLLDDDDLHHFGRVLRLRAGESVSVSNGEGGWRMCRFVADGGLEPDSDVFEHARVAPALTVGFALPKGDRLEWIVQKLTEIGVDRIVVLDAERSVVRWQADRVGRQLAKLAKVGREAAMQSRRVWLPLIDGPHSPATLNGTATALAEPGGSVLTLATPTVLIGPEGGWSPVELAASDQHRRLGSTILRVETAALAAAVRLSALRDELATE